MKGVTLRAAAWALLVGPTATGCATAVDPAVPAPSRNAVSPESTGATLSDSHASDGRDVSPAEALVTFASQGRSHVAWGTTVTYSIASERVERFASATANERGSWYGCPIGPGEYEGRKCPVSPMDTLAAANEADGVVYESKGPEAVGCNVYSAPPRASVEETVWIGPLEHVTAFLIF
jgi:hypothetical protein